MPLEHLSGILTLDMMIGAQYLNTVVGSSYFFLYYFYRLYVKKEKIEHGYEYDDRIIVFNLKIPTQYLRSKKMTIYANINLLGIFIKEKNLRVIINVKKAPILLIQKPCDWSNHNWQP